MTKARKMILNLLCTNSKPLSAAEITTQIATLFDPATVYRTLHYLEEKSFCESFVLHCSVHGTERFYTARKNEDESSIPHKHWFHCEKCHQFTDLGSCELHSLIEQYETNHSLKINAHTLYFTGTCSMCL